MTKHDTWDNVAARTAAEPPTTGAGWDALYKQLFRELLSYMIEDPRTTSRALHLLLIARNYERVADHATNIAEDVVFYVEGRDIRHLAAVDISDLK